MSQVASSAPAVPAHAGIFFPPPLTYAIGIGAGVMLNRWYPRPITSGASPVRWLLVVLFAAGYLAVFASAWRAFRRARTTLVPNKPATAIVTEGPYRWTRNPMYVSLVLLYVAAALAVNNWWSLAFLPIVALVIDRAVIAREERYLAAAFPEEYAAYRQRVRRWF